MASPGAVQGQTRASQDGIHRCWGVGLVVVLCMLCGSGLAQSPGRPTGELTVFAAASLTEPFTEIGKRLEAAHTGLKIIYNFGGSPTLRTQIEQGARADVFVSADMAQMELARKNGMVQGETPVFVKNRLVVIVPRSNPGQVTTFRDLAKPGLKLTLAAPKVPVGNYIRAAQAGFRSVDPESEHVAHTFYLRLDSSPAVHDLEITLPSYVYHRLGLDTQKHLMAELPRQAIHVIPRQDDTVAHATPQPDAPFTRITPEAEKPYA